MTTFDRLTHPPQRTLVSCAIFLLIRSCKEGELVRVMARGFGGLVANRAELRRGSGATLRAKARAVF